MNRRVPDFAKLHEKEFNKADTLDEHIIKKKERAEALTPIPRSAKKISAPTPIPDFKRMHEKEFNKTDTLVEHIAKKKERANTLTPMPRSAKKMRALTPIPRAANKIRMNICSSPEEDDDEVERAEALTPIPCSAKKIRAPMPIPDFKKMHEKEFNKTDTLVEHIAKKKERADALTPMPRSAKKMRALTPIPRAAKKIRMNICSSPEEDDDEVRLVEMAKDTNITQRSNIPKIVKRKVPDFAKLHAREFNKTDTLDNYLTKKKERANALTPGPKSAKKVPMNGDVKKKMPVMASLDGSLKNVHVRRSPRNVETGGNKNFENRERKGFVPTNITVNAANFKFSQGSANRNINQRQAVNSLKKPFVFSAKENITSVKPEKILSNITNSPSVNKVSHQQANLNRKQTSSKPFAYKPYTGKVGQWNPKKTLEERKALANKTAPRTKKGELIKGVRLNKRAELLMNKRGIHAKD